MSIYIVKSQKETERERNLILRNASWKLAFSEVRGNSWEEVPHLQAAQAQEGQEELLHVQGQEGRLVQGKEQRMRFAGAAIKRYPTIKVREKALTCSNSPEVKHCQVKSLKVYMLYIKLAIKTNK